MGIQDDLLANDELPGEVVRLNVARQSAIAPEKASRILEMQMQTGLPEDLIERNLEDVEHEAFRANFNVEEFRKNNPIFSKWAAENPNHWAAAQDDIEALNAFEWAAAAFKGKYKEGTAEVRLNQIWARHQAGNATDAELEEAEALEAQTGLHDFGAGWFGEFITESGKQLPQMFGGMRQGAQLGMPAAMGGALIAGVAGQAGPQIAVPEELITVPAAFVTAGTAGFLSGAALWAEEQERGASFREISRLTDENGMPLDVGIARTASTWVGMINGLLEATGTGAVAKYFPGVKQLRESIVKDSVKQALKNPTFRRALGEFAKNTAESVGIEVATEIMQESVSMFAAEFAKMADPGDFESITSDEFADALVQIANTTFKATLLPGSAGPLVNLSLDAKRVRDAQVNRKIFEALGESSSNSKLRERVPGKYREFVQRVRENGAVDTIRIPVERFKEYFQGLEVDPALMYEELGGTVEAFVEADITGTDIEISLEDYAEKLAPSEHHAALLDDLRLHPDEMTGREAQQWQENSAEIVTELEAGLDQATDLNGYQAVYDDVYGQLLSADFESSAAEQNAALMASVFATLGERTGVAAEDLYQRYGLQVTREALGRQSPGQVDIDIDPMLDRLRRGEIPTDREVHGDSLIDFVKALGGLQDQGGELAARDVRQSVRGLVNPQGLTLDGAAEHAFGAGFISQYDENEFIEALDRELGGDPVFSNMSTDSSLLGLQGALQDLSESLDREEIDLQDMDNEAVKALLQGDGSQTFEQSSIGFTSGLLRAAQNLKQAKGSAQQMLATLKKQPGVKQEELDWTGLPEFLRAKKTVTKDELVEFLEANGVQVEEVTLGSNQNIEAYKRAELAQEEAWDLALEALKSIGDLGFDSMGDTLEAFREHDDWAARWDVPDEEARVIQRYINAVDERHRLAAGNTNGVYVQENEDGEFDVLAPDGTIIDVADIRADAELIAEGATEYNEPAGGEAKFGEYTLPGGENYREVLLTLPTPETPRYERTDLKLNATESRDRDGGIFWIIDAPGQTYQIPKTKYADPEEAVQYVMREKSPDALPPVTYVGGHFEQSNVLAHIRINDRTGPNGEKILFIEEIQSDWHQAGRKSGYRGQLTHDTPLVGKRIKDADGRVYFEVSTDTGRFVTNVWTVSGQAEISEEQAIATARERLRTDSARTAEANAVPDAPFKGNAWAELSLKRVIRLAAEGGYDQVGWTTGEQQADRYDLSKKVESITHSVNLDGTINFNVIDIDGRDVVERLDAPQSEVEAILGKEVTDKIVNREGKVEKGRDEIRERGRAVEVFSNADKVPTFRIENIGGQWAALQGTVEMIRTRPGEDLTREQAKEVLTERILARNEQSPRWFIRYERGDEMGTWVSEEDAQKAADTTNRDYIDNPVENDPKVLSGIDLKVGGEGMKSFYDRTLRNIMQKVVKKMDKGVRVGGSIIGQAREPERAVDLNEWRISDFDSGEILWGSKNEFDVADAVKEFEKNGLTVEVFRPGKPHHKNQYSVHAVPISDQMKRKAMEGMALFQGDKKPLASINIGEATRQVAINLRKAANLSSFLHESGHFYLEVLGDLAEANDAPTQIVQDYAAILKWMGVENRQGIAREQHELFARGFEAYLMEGKAPSVELQNAFARFRAWLIGIYRNLSSLQVELNDDIRSVFDRLVATDAAISGAEESQNYVALFSSAEDAGMTPEQYAVYQEGVSKARIEAEDSLSQKLLAVKTREQRKWWKAEREKMRDTVTDEVHKMRVYRALAFLQKGTEPDGTPLDLKHIKLSKDDLVQRYGTEFLKRLPRPYVYSRIGGANPDEIALNFGYTSGDELVQDLANTQKMSQVIEGETDARMKEKFPDPMLDGTLAEEAINAVHSDKRAELLAAELRTLRRLAAENRPAVRAAQSASQREQREAREANRGTLPDRDELKLIKIAAVQMIGRKKVRAIAPHTYRTAESKAARAAFDAASKGNYEKAYFEKRRQVLNHELYRAAEQAKAESLKIRDYFAKFSKKRVRQRLGKAQDGVLEKIETILIELDLRRISGAEINRNQAKREMLDAIERGELVASGNVIRELERAKLRNWRELTMEGFRGLRDIIKQLETQARREAEVVINGEKLKFDTVASEIVDSIESGGKQIDIGIGEPTRGDNFKRGAAEAIAAWLRPSAIARLLDDGKDFGAVTKYVIVPMRRAYAEKLIPMQRKARDDVGDIYNKHYSTKELAGLYTRKHYDILNATLTKSDVLSIALNWGNEGNQTALLNGISFGDAAFSRAGIMQVLSSMDSRDWAFVQDVWDYLDTYWGQLSAAQKQRRGIAPDKVPATPFTMTGKDGKVVNLKGGYYPLKYDSRHSDRQKERDVEDYFEKMGNGFYVSANTRAGATHGRVGSAFQVVRLGLGIIDQHLREITRDIAIGDEVNFIKRVLNHKDVRNVMKQTGNDQALKTLNLWLQDSAVGELPADGVVEKGLAWVRVGFTKSKLGWNALTTMLQFTGFAQTWAVVGSQSMSHGVGRYARNPVEAHKQIMSQSKFLQTRYEAGAWDKDVADAQAFMAGVVPTAKAKAIRAISSTYFLPIAKAQMVVDEITWLSAMWKGVNVEGLTQENAVVYADGIVEQAQTSGFFSDRSGIERGTVGWRNTRQSQFVRMWTTLISYMLAKAGIAYEKGAAFRKRPSLKGAVTLAADYVALFVVEAALAAAIYGRWPDEDDDEPFAWWLAKESVESAVSGIPFVREVPAAMFGSGNTPMGGLAKDIFDLGIQVSQGEIDKQLIKELNNVGGTLFHYPSSQTNRAIDAYWRETEGDDVPIYEYLTGDRDYD